MILITVINVNNYSYCFLIIVQYSQFNLSKNVTSNLKIQHFDYLKVLFVITVFNICLVRPSKKEPPHAASMMTRAAAPYDGR